MPLTYEKDNLLDHVMQLSQLYNDWRVAILTSNAPQSMVDVASAVNKKIAEISPRFDFNKPLFASFIAEHEKLSQLLITNAGDAQALFNAQRTTLETLSKQASLHDFGFDPQSGLKNLTAMHRDLSAELERLARRGNPFSVAVASIDYFTDMQKIFSAEELENIFQTIGQCFRQTARAFDDAYRFSENEFVMSLKLTDPAGGRAAVERLKKSVESANLTFKNSEGKDLAMTMSFCVASPVPGDTMKELLENMREDLDRWREDEKGSTIEYIEVSPLERYLSSET